MSKSRGNGVDPIERFDKFGVDATRIYLASIATGADIRLERYIDRNLPQFRQQNLERDAVLFNEFRRRGS